MTAPWAGRYGHTSVIDAAGAIYVIGGTNYGTYGTTHFNDMWVSTDGGAQPDSRGCSRVLRRYSGVLGGLQGVLEGKSRDTQGV
jgi:hypothetical protein